MSTQAFQEYQQLQDIIQQLQISQDNKDVWEYIWGGHQYAASKFYNLAYKFVQPPKPFLWIWDSRCSNKLSLHMAANDGQVKCQKYSEKEEMQARGKRLQLPLMPPKQRRNNFPSILLLPL
jgi:hypothetical protein